MPDYGFSINMDGDVLAKMEKVEKALTKLANDTNTNVNQVNKKLGEMGNSLRKVGEVIAATFAVEKIKEFGMELLHTTAEFEGFRNVIKYSSLNAYDAGVNLDYITNAARRLHLPLREATEGFAEMQAGLIGTGIEGQRLRNLFEGISTASSVLHLSAYNLQRTLYDFKEIGEIGLNQRIMRSLQTALPGVGEIIKETFHKSFQQLEKEHFNGGQFLAGLSEGLKKHFGAGLANASNSLIAKINDMQSAWTRFKLQLGENLRPTFISIMTGIEHAFNSEPVQFFVKNIATLVNIVAKIIPMWIIYKTIMLSIEGITRLAAWAQMMYAGAMGESTVMIRGTTVAVEGFSEALLATGVGVFAVALGLIVEQFMKVNSQIAEAVDRLTNLKKLGGVNDILSDQAGIETKWKAVDKFTAPEKSAMLADMQQKIADQQSQINTELSPALAEAKANRAKFIEKSKFTEKLDESIKSLTYKLSQAQGGITNEQAHVDALKRAGVRMPKLTPFAQNGNGMENSSLHTSELAGAKGGLGEAKTITIHFHDALQKIQVMDGRGIKAAGQSAIEVIIRTLNNLAYGQSRTM